MQFEPSARKTNPTDVLNFRRLPAKLNQEQAAALLGFAAHDIPALIRAKLLKPLGNPIRNACKWFSSHELEELRLSRKWLDSAMKAVSRRSQKSKPVDQEDQAAIT
jgi:hypothetical protein